MTDKEKLEKLKKLADVMYYAAQQLTTDASRLHKAMDEYHKFIIHKCKEEPVSEELEDAAKHYLYSNILYDDVYVGNPTDKDCIEMFKAGANWQKEQFEKNRLKHCDSITNEQAELEQGFIDQHLDKYQRIPTFLDAIEYGMKLKEQQFIKDAVEAKITLLDGISYVDKKALSKYKAGDKIKIVIIKDE